MKETAKTIAKMTAIAAAICAVLYTIAFMRFMNAIAEISGLNMMKRNNK